MSYIRTRGKNSHQLVIYQGRHAFGSWYSPLRSTSVMALTIGLEMRKASAIPDPCRTAPEDLCQGCPQTEEQEQPCRDG